MSRVSWERTAAIASVAFVVLYVVAFALGIEVGASDREILDYYGDSGHRTKEVIAFFCIAGAAIALIVFAATVRRIIERDRSHVSVVGLLALCGGIAAGTLLLAGNALSRATAFSAMDAEFTLEPNTRRLFENAGFLLFASGALAAILLVSAVAVAALRHGVFPRWLGWTSIVVAVLLPLAIAFIGFLVFVLWLLLMGATQARGGDSSARPQPGSS